MSNERESCHAGRLLARLRNLLGEDAERDGKEGQKEKHKENEDEMEEVDQEETERQVV